jgi:hypothetical protein
MSKDRPIIFSAPMVRALLEGRKTMTRRVLSRLNGKGAIAEFGPSTTDGYQWHFRDSHARWNDIRDARLFELLPISVGDRLWVREAWRASSAHDDLPPRDIPVGDAIEYSADPERVVTGRNRPGMFLPRWASRLTLIVKGVKVERLHDISLQDVRAEGCEVRQMWLFGADAKGRQEIGANAFRGLWESINGAESWSLNPWVTAISFRVIRANIDGAKAREK